MGFLRNIFIYSLVHIIAYSAIGQTKQKQLFFEDPRAGSFTIFTDIPVSHTTGIPDISIPLFTLESHGYKIPITLKYHLAMVKPPYDYTNVATGWVLETGGTITQEFKSQDDLKGMQPDVFRTNLSAYATDQAERNYINYVYLQNYDTEHDLFTYSFADKNGKFIIDKSSTEGKYNITPLTASHLQGSINTIHYTNPSDYTFQNIQIADDQGYNYFFRDYEHYGISTNISYFLNEIQTPNGIPLYSFEYTNCGGTGITFSLQNLLVSDEEHYAYYYVPGGQSGNITGRYSVATSPMGISFNPQKTVKKITFENGTLEFTLSANSRYVDGMVLKDKNGNALKTVSFDMGYFPGQGYRCLNKVYIKNNAQNIVETYALNYNGSTVSVSNNNLSVDFWGYLRDNVQSQPFGFVPMETFSFDVVENVISNPPGTTTGTTTYTLTMGDGSRQPLFSGASVYTLNSITYPTGGRSEFTYGLNEYTSGQGGGLRIEKITNYTGGNTIAWQKRYAYTLGEIDFDPAQRYETTVNTYDIHQSPASEFVVFHRERYFPYKKTPPVSDNRVRYKQVTEYWENGTNDIGKTVYDYNYYHLNYYEPSDNHYYVRALQDYIESGLLDKKTVYKKNGTAYVILSEEVYNYSFGEMGRVKNLFMNMQNVYTSNVGIQGIPWDLIDIYGTYMHSPGFYPFYYDYIVGTYKLTHKATTNYSDNGTLTEVRDYEYSDGLDKYITGESITASDQAIKKTNFKYAYATDYASQFPYNQMIAKNIISEPVEIKTWAIRGNENNLLSTVKYNFNQFGQNIFRPESVLEALGANPLETRFIYNYDTQIGNLISTKNSGGDKISYTYDDSKSYPVAQIVNAEVKDIFYTSFEDTEGNSSDGDSKTGKKSRTGGFSKALSNLTNGDYILSWWQKSGTTWIFQKNAVAITNGTYAISLTAQVDEVRFYPATAQMTTYTYSPLIGITSKCDAGSHITYYEYDEAGRLSHIRDLNRNILKKFCYNYAGQPENCNLFGNTLKSQLFTKNNCSSPQVGDEVWYIVQANKHYSSSQSAADEMAQADIIANGQAYANENGLCRFASSDVSGNYYSQNCSENEVPVPVYVFMPAGQFRSLLSQEDANLQAIDAAQAIANQNGQCEEAVMIDLNYTNSNPGPKSIELTNIATNQVYQFTGNPGSGVLGTLPAGIYNIYAPGDTAFEICSLYSYGYLYNVEISAQCSTVIFY